eukprot:CAMPEP_0202978612 /NCGR_PEP_ID=MMETSP1396-20130829/84977_1 /ASSEMBLY_ACC=CAM_ASM_000872 /TAXON_ID= /ORGANISM="Pseudokeronopsis sp., Strain Brazil" /LENGTH=57 /DNA_ID=CAMNT_0049717645 /DNA_START=991 /DNA_END=1164 /DNA_ORIENTATION=-
MQFLLAGGNLMRGKGTAKGMPATVDRVAAIKDMPGTLDFTRNNHIAAAAMNIDWDHK